MSRYLSLPRSRRIASGLATVGAAVLLLAACSSEPSDEPNASSGETSASTALVDEATAMIADYSSSPEFVAPPSFDASGAKGKKVWWIADQNTEIVNVWREYGEQGFAAAGVEFVLHDGQNSMDEHIRGFELAIADGADAIVLADGYPAEAFAEQIKAASDAGIAVIGTLAGVPGEAPDVQGLTTDVTYNYQTVGELLAAWVVADSQGKANVLLINRSDIASSNVEADAFLAELERLCPECIVSESEVNGGNQTTEVPTLVQTAIASNSDLNYVVPTFDSMALWALPAINQAGAADTVKMLSYNATSAMMQNLQSGTAFVMDIGGPNGWFAYATVDATLRALVGEEPVEDPQIGLTIFTNESVQGKDLSEESDDQWYGADYTSPYLAVWGLE